MVLARTTRVLDPHVRGLPFLATDTDLRAYFYDYFRLAAALRAEPGNEQQAADRADWSTLELSPDTLVAIEGSRPERTRGGVYALGDILVASLMYGRRLKYARAQAENLFSGAAAVMSAGDLQAGPEPTTLGEQWRVGPADARAALLPNIVSGEQTRIDLVALWDSVGDYLRLRHPG